MATGVEVSIHFVDKPADILKKVNREIARVLNKHLREVAKRSQDALQKKLGRFFYDTDEYTEILRTGRGHFGFPKGTEKSRLRAIIEALQSTVQVSSTRLSLRGGNELRGGLKVEAFPDDFNYLFSLPEAKVITEKNDEIAWLFNMLLSGDRIVIADYFIRFGSFIESRSGIAQMVRHTGSSWRVPPKLAGFAGDNWITRAVNTFQNSIEFIIGDEFQQVFNKLRIQ